MQDFVHINQFTDGYKSMFIYKYLYILSFMEDKSVSGCGHLKLVGWWLLISHVN